MHETWQTVDLTRLEAVCILQRAEPWTRMIATEGSNAYLAVAREVKWHMSAIRQSFRAQSVSGSMISLKEMHEFA